MKKTVFLRCLVIVLSLGIVAMSLTGCEGPAGPAGADGNTVPSFLQGTWVNSSSGTGDFIFTADKVRYVYSATTEYSGIYLSFTPIVNSYASTKDEYPAGYEMSFISVEGTGAYLADNNTLRTRSFYFNADRTKFVEAGTNPWVKQ